MPWLTKTQFPQTISRHENEDSVANIASVSTDSFDHDLKTKPSWLTVSQRSLLPGQRVERHLIYNMGSTAALPQEEGNRRKNGAGGTPTPPRPGLPASPFPPPLVVSGASHTTRPPRALKPGLWLGGGWKVT